MSSTAVLERPQVEPPRPAPSPVQAGTALWLKLLTVATVVLAVGALVIATSKPSKAEKKDASIAGYAFKPGTMTVNVGDTVTWTNSDSAPHTVTSSSGPAKIDSPTLQKGDTFSYTFTLPGTYQYYCAIHPDMKGTVTVLAAAAPMAENSPSTGAAPPPAPTSGHSMSTPAAPAAPATPPAPAASMAAPSGPAANCLSKTAASAMAQPLVTHLEKAHLETSPGQQVADLLSLDQYVKTHTVLLEDMLKPLMAVILALPDGMVPLMTHLDKAHLETSPGQQVADLLAVDQYVKTHTVLTKSILAPTTGALTAASC